MGTNIQAASPANTTGLAWAIFTTTQQRVLGCLFGHPQRSFYSNELIRLTGSGSGAVQRELKRLLDAGLLTVEKLGGQTHYKANPCRVVNPTVYSQVDFAKRLAENNTFLTRVLEQPKLWLIGDEHAITS